MKVVQSACKHGLTKDEVLHAGAHAIRLVEYDYQGEERILAIGATPSGAVLEIVAVPGGDPARSIHADNL